MKKTVFEIGNLIFHLPPALSFAHAWGHDKFNWNKFDKLLIHADVTAEAYTIDVDSREV